MWKVGGTKIERTGARYIFFMCVHGNSRKSNFLGKTLRTRKFSTKKNFGAATSGILTHSGFRKYSLFGWSSLCYRGSKSGHRPKTGRVQRCDSAIFWNEENIESQYRSPCSIRFQVVGRKLAEWLWSVKPKLRRDKSWKEGQLRQPVTRH